MVTPVSVFCVRCILPKPESSLCTLSCDVCSDSGGEDLSGLWWSRRCFLGVRGFGTGRDIAGLESAPVGGDSSSLSLANDKMCQYISWHNLWKFIWGSGVGW